MTNHTKTRVRRRLPLLLLLFSAACRTGEPQPRSDLAGVWDLESVDGAALPAPSPEEPNVLLRSVTMTLGAGGDYALLSAFRMADKPTDSEATVGGSWVATGQALTFYNDGDVPAVVEFGYHLEGDALHMTDQLGHVWAMRRRR